ncbi:Sua5/YciO/YrdC/YwlC family protein [candidate division WOR-3 bacterium]|nr:Sua5/YciO/YrdC/YwlC family protein [candidate division WOR-3 bacterium]
MIPTDTVWGFAFSPESKEAYEKVLKLKKRNPDKRVPILTYSIDRAYRLFDNFNPRIYGLTQKYWPGSLTVVGKASKKVPEHLVDENGKIAVRVPKKPAPLDIIKALDIMPATSANISGENNPADLSHLSSMFSKEEFHFLNKTKSLPAKPASTVIETTGKKMTVLRKGEISPFVLGDLTSMDIKYQTNEPLSICFVCEGNTCRSPMAEYILKLKSTKTDIKLNVSSAGLKVDNKSFVYSDKTLRVIKEKYGVDISGKPKKICKKDIEEADLILTMDAKIQKKVQKSGGQGKTKLISEFSHKKTHVADPYGKDYEAYLGVASELENHIDNLIKYLASRNFTLIT